MNEEGVTKLTEYIIITGMLLLLMIIMMFTVNATLMDGPADRLRHHAFVDIGNGISTRIVDLYVIAPDNGTITTKFDIPDDVAGAYYNVDISLMGRDQVVQVQRNNIQSRIALAGIGATRGVSGETTGMGLNTIRYDSSGFSIEGDEP